jgi:hypothetical protein
VSTLRRKSIAIAHLIIIIAAYLSPFYIPLQIIFIIILLYYFQLLIFKGCILSKAQFGSTNDRFVKHYFEKITGIKVDREKMDIILDKVIPALILLTAYIYQITLRR